MNKENPQEELSNIHIPPIGDVLKSDIKKYKEFMNYENLIIVYKNEFLDSFFGFVSYLQEFDINEQRDILESPSEHNSSVHFGLYMDIFEAFLNIYGQSSSRNKNRFDRYADIISDAKKSFIDKTREEISKAMKPEYAFDLFETYSKKYELGFYDILDLISQDIGEHKYFAKGMNLDIVRSTIEDEKNPQEKILLETDIYNNIIKSFLIENIHICQKYISEKDKEEIQKTSSQESETGNSDIYNQIIDHLSKQEFPVILNIDPSVSFVRPILNSKDFDRLYNDLMSYIGAEFNDPEYIYPKGYSIKNGSINNIKFEYENEEGEKLSPIDYIIRLATDRIDQDDDDSKRDDQDDDDSKRDDQDDDSDDHNIYNEKYIEDAANVIGENIENFLNDADESEDDTRQFLIDTTIKVRKELPKYYQINIYTGFYKKLGLPVFTIQLDQYINEFDEKGQRLSVKKNPKPVIIKPTFAISDKIDNQYIPKFVSFMDFLSPNYNVFEGLGIKENESNEEDDDNNLVSG